MFQPQRVIQSSFAASGHSKFNTLKQLVQNLVSSSLYCNFFGSFGLSTKETYRVIVLVFGQYDAFYSIISQTKDNPSVINVAIYSMNLPFFLSNFKQVCMLSFHLTFIT